jgi:hypothetical protein
VDDETLGRGRIMATTIAPQAIDEPMRIAMFALFERHYNDVSRDQFEAALAAKDTAILLHSGGVVIGFTTAAYSTFAFAGHDIGILFSGDTIVDPAFWGEQELARTWLQEIGRVTARSEGRALYWLLIVKGHRTYRYLPAFALNYVPSAGGSDNPELIALRNAVAAERFGSAFDPVTGVIRFAEPRGRLHPDIADPLPRERSNPHVRFFLEANPGFRNGDELACLCALSADNMRPRARRWFADGDA